MSMVWLRSLNGPGMVRPLGTVRGASLSCTWKTRSRGGSGRACRVHVHMGAVSRTDTGEKVRDARGEQLPVRPGVGTRVAGTPAHELMEGRGGALSHIQVSKMLDARGEQVPI